jgi:hypothetical protein
LRQRHNVTVVVRIEAAHAVQVAAAFGVTTGAERTPERRLAAVQVTQWRAMDRESLP